MMPAPFSEDLQWRVIRFVQCSSAFSCRGFYFLGRFWKNSSALYFYITCNWRCKVGDNKPFIRGNEERIQLKKAWVSFVFGVKNPQTNVHSWSNSIPFPARWTQLMKFGISNSVTTVLFGLATSIRHLPSFSSSFRHSLWQPFLK